MGILGDAWGSVRDAGSSMFGYNTTAENEAQEASEQATQAGESERQRLAQESQALQDGVEGYEDPGIMQCENWSAYSHEDLYKTNQGSIDEGRVNEIADVWTKIGGGLRERGPQFDSKLQSIISEGWQGEAADQAKTIGKPTAQWMEGSGNAFELTGNKLSEAGSGAGQVKQMVPEPEGHSWGRTAAASVPLGVLGGGADAVKQMNERKEAENAAREAMGRVYSPTLTDVDSQVPQFQKPDGSIAKPGDNQQKSNTNWGNGDPTGQNVPNGTDSGIGDGSGSGTGTGNGTGTGPDMGNVPGPGNDDLGNINQGPGSPGGPGSVQPLPDKGNLTPPDSTDSDWAEVPGPGQNGPGQYGPNGPGQYGPNGPNSPGSSNVVGGLPGGGSAGAGAGGGAAAGGAGALGAGAKSGAGMAGAGGAGAGGAAGAGAGRGAGAGAAGGRGGAMGGAPMGGRGGGQGGDDEHERPSWLEENDDIWLNDMPKTAPPVLGG